MSLGVVVNLLIEFLSLGQLLDALSFIEARAAVIQSNPILGFALYPSLSSALSLASSISTTSSSATGFSALHAIVDSVRSAGEILTSAQAASAAATGSVKPASRSPVSLVDFDWASAGLVSDDDNGLKSLLNDCMFL